MSKRKTSDNRSSSVGRFEIVVHSNHGLLPQYLKIYRKLYCNNLLSSLIIAKSDNRRS